MPKYLQQDQFFALCVELPRRALEVVEVWMEAFLLEEVVEAVQGVAADHAVAFEEYLHTVL